jgi:dipeptidyl-peptidase-4
MRLGLPLYSISTAVAVALVAALPVPASSQNATAPRKLTIRDIIREGGLTGKPPESMAWAPDGERLSYISEDGDLMQVDSFTAKTTVLVGRSKLTSLNSANSNEKDKDHRSRYNMAGYIWAPDARHLLFDSNGQLWIYDLHNGTGVEIGYSGNASGDDPKFAPDGKDISFVRDHNLYVCHLRLPGTPTVSVSNNKDPNFFAGEVDWLYLEELDTRSNYFWSPDSREIAYMQMNEMGVPEYPLVDWIPNHATIDRQRYPQPGDPNPNVHVGVVNANGGKTVWMKIPLQEGQDYIPRFGWVNPKKLWIETLSRDHKHRNLYFADPVTGAATLALEIKDDKFLDEDYDITFGQSRFLLTSWQDGHSHIYVYSFDQNNPTTAKLEIQLTSGDYEVSAIAGVDESSHTILFASNEGDPRQQHVWHIRLDGKEKRALTESHGFHEPLLAPIGPHFVDTYSSTMSPITLSMCTMKGDCKPFWKSRSIDAYKLVAPENLEIKASDGTTLYADLLLPPQKIATATVPLIVNPYGGPHVQTVRDAWSNSFLFDQVLAQHGYAVLHTDNRGMGSRGRDFAQAAYRNMGAVQLEDQLRVIDEVLKRNPRLDPNRLGWWGWSWGGTFTLNALTNSPRFLAGVAVAPVTDWHNYDSIYTERYLGNPAENSQSYHDYSVINGAQNLKGHLLLMQGTGDDNVHMGNSIQFIQRLIEFDIPYDLQLYPRKTHSIAGPEARTHLYQKILSHFDLYLMNPGANVTDEDTDSDTAPAPTKSGAAK